MNTMILEMPAMEEILTRLEKIDSRLESLEKTTSLTGIWLTTKEAAKALKVTPRCLQNYRDRGDIPFSQFGREVRYYAEDIRQFLMDHYVKGKAEGRDAA